MSRHIQFSEPRLTQGFLKDKYHQERSCTRKIGYLSLGAAVLKATELNEIPRDYPIQQPYKCHYGEHWHVGRISRLVRDLDRIRDIANLMTDYQMDDRVAHCMSKEALLPLAAISDLCKVAERHRSAEGRMR